MFIKCARLALINLAFLVLIPTFANPAAHAQSASKGENAREDQSGGKDFTPIPRPIRQQSKPAIYLANCTQPKNHDEADLCEQMRMADAAKEAVRVGYWQTGVGIGAVIAGGLAALFTAWAAWAASRAARVAERALVDLERPVVFVEIPESGLSVETREGKFELAGRRVKHQAANYGRTPALLTEYHPTFEVLDKGSFPDPIDPDVARGRELPVGCVSVAGKPYDEGETSFKTYPLKLFEMHAADKYSIFFIGFLRYADIHGARYVTGFCFAYDWIGDKFVRRGDKQYNYTRREDA